MSEVKFSAETNGPKIKISQQTSMAASYSTAALASNLTETPTKLKVMSPKLDSSTT